MELCLLPDMMATLLFKIYLALSQRLGEKEKKTVPCQRRAQQFQIATCLRVSQRRDQIHFLPWVPLEGHPLQTEPEGQASQSIYLTVLCFSLSPRMRKFKTYQK